MYQEQQNDLCYFYPVKPNNERQQTDNCCKIVYAILTIITIIAFFYSYILEKQQNLFIPKDPSGNRCGQGEATNYPFIYFPAPFPESISKSVCVSECPSSLKQRQVDCLPNQIVKQCTLDMTDHFNRQNQFILYPTTGKLSNKIVNQFLKLCQPEDHILNDAINEKINTQKLFMSFEDLYLAKNVIIFVCPAVCIFLMFTYLLLILCCQNMKPIFVSIILCFLFTIAYFSFYFFLPKTIEIVPYSRLIGTLILIGLIFIIVSLIVQRRYISKSLDLINIGTEYVRDNKILVLMPLGMLFLWALFFIVQLTVIIFIYSIDSSDQQSKNQQNTFPYILSLNHSLIVKLLLILTIVHYIWTNIIIQHLGKYVSRVGASFWVMHIPKHFKAALYSLFTFHIGSVLKGSVVITLYWWITQFLYFIMPDSNNLLFCCKFPKLSKFYKGQIFHKYLGCYTELNYIKIGLDGQNYEQSIDKLTPTLVNNLKFINQGYKIAKRIMDLSQLLVVILTTTICFFVLEFSEQLSTHITTIIIIFIFSLLITGFGFDAYDRAFQTILLTVIINVSNKKNILDRVGISALADYNQGDKKLSSRRMKVYKQIKKWIQSEKQRHLQERELNP